MYEFKIIRGSLILVLSLFTLVASSSSARAQGLETKLAQRVKAFDSESSTSLAQLIDFARQFGVPMGIEWRDEAEGRATPPIHARNTTAQNVLRQILRTEPDKRYRITGGVIHVFTLPILNDGRNFLNLRISKFQVENQNLFGAEYLLRMSIHQILSRSQGYGGGHGYGVPRNDKFDVRNLNLVLNGTTVREILNALAAGQGNALWVVRMNPPRLMDNRRFYSQLLSLSGREAAPDFQWEFVPLR